MITIRSLHKDIARYNAADNAEEAQEEFGWKLVHGLGKKIKFEFFFFGEKFIILSTKKNTKKNCAEKGFLAPFVHNFASGMIFYTILKLTNLEIGEHSSFLVIFSDLANSGF